MVEVFLGREALGDGLKRHELRRWYRPMFRGVYIPKRATPSLRDRTVGAWLTSDRKGVIAGVAASALHGAEWVDDVDITEVIIATDPNTEGEATATYLVRMLRDIPGLTVTRIASGLPMGGDLEFADELTLGRALVGRRAMA